MSRPVTAAVTVSRRAWADVVGQEGVDQDPASLDLHSRDESFVAGKAPAVILRPTTADQVARIVRLAGETATPLVPISSGPPHFRGDTVPLVEGSAVVDLSQMRRVIRVDRENRVVMFEPGVTFAELTAAVNERGLRLNAPLAPRFTKSVVGSLLEREPVILPKYHWDISDPLACVEVVFGTGDVFRTGSAAGPGSVEDQWQAGGAQKEAAGPSAASWYRIIQGAQGTMGIVTWASARCELKPRVEKPFLAGADQLDPLIQAMHWLVRRRLVNECFVLDRSSLLSLMAAAAAGDADSLDGAPKAEALPEWVLFFNVAGYEYFPDDRLEGQLADALDIAEGLGLEPLESLGSLKASAVLTAVQTQHKGTNWKLQRHGAAEEVSFLCSHRMLPLLVEVVNSGASTSGLDRSDIGAYLQPLVQGTCCHCEFNFFYDPRKPERAQAVRDLARDLLPTLMDRGAFFSRPYGPAADLAYRRDPNSAAALRKVKAIVDPLNLLNPSKLCFGDC